MSTINPTGVKQEQHLSQSDLQPSKQSDTGKVSSTVFKALSAQEARADELLREENRDQCTEQCSRKYLAKLNKPCVSDCMSINKLQILLDFGSPR